jgi:hypothetical protein
VARCLIIGCGCRGLSLARELLAGGQAVRATTRNAARVEQIVAAGAEPFVGDPDRVGTLAPALAQVGVACVLLGSASGSRERLAALHGTRLAMLLERMLDTTVRGVVYESAGSVDRDVLAEGANTIRRVCEGSLIPYVLLDADPGEHAAWLDAAQDAVAQVLHS